MSKVYVTKQPKYIVLYSLLFAFFIFLNGVSIAQVSEVDDRPEILKNFDGSDEEYQEIKKQYYKENGLFDESEDSWSAVSEEAEIECDIKFDIPNNINQPSELKGTWEIIDVIRNGSKDFDKELGDPTILHDFNSDNHMILSQKEGTFSHLLSDKSFWEVKNSTLTLSSFNKEACMVETIDFTIVRNNKEELELNVNDPDGQEDVNYDIKLKLIEK